MHKYIHCVQVLELWLIYIFFEQTEQMQSDLFQIFLIKVDYWLQVQLFVLHVEIMNVIHNLT